MVYVEGPRLDEWAETERPGAREVARKVPHVGRALVAAHAAASSTGTSRKPTRGDTTWTGPGSGRAPGHSG